MDVFLSLPHLPFVSGITLVDEAKDDIEEDEASQKLVAGIQYAYSKPKVQRKVYVGLNCYIFYHLMQVGGGGVILSGVDLFIKSFLWLPNRIFKGYLVVM